MIDVQPEGILILQHLYFWVTITTKRSTCINITTNSGASAKHEELQNMIHPYRKLILHEDNQAK